VPWGSTHAEPLLFDNAVQESKDQIYRLRGAGGLLVKWLVWVMCCCFFFCFGGSRGGEGKPDFLYVCAFPVISTCKLTRCGWRDGDVALVVQVCSDVHVIKHPHVDQDPRQKNSLFGDENP
jgi:hypothetical protein